MSPLDRTRSLRDDLRLAMQRVEEAIATPASGGDWLQMVGSALGVLSEKLEAHIEGVEGPGGLHQDILEQAPRLSGAVSEMHEDHLKLRDALAALRERVSHATPEDYPAVRRRTLSLLGHLAEHRQIGSDLVYEAYMVDIGGIG